MRAILIDPHQHVIEEVDTPAKLQNMYDLIGCHTIEAVRMDNTHIMWVDGEGMFVEDQRFFMIVGCGPYAGKALILGATSDGENAATTIELSMVKGAVEWVRPDLEYAGEAVTEEEGELFGGKAFVIRSTSLFTTKKKGEAEG